MKSLIAVAILVLIRRPGRRSRPASSSPAPAARAAPVALKRALRRGFARIQPDPGRAVATNAGLYCRIAPEDSGDPARNAQPEAETTEGLRRFFRGLLGYPPPEFLAAPSARLWSRWENDGSGDLLSLLRQGRAGNGNLRAFTSSRSGRSDRPPSSSPSTGQRLSGTGHLSWRDQLSRHGSRSGRPRLCRLCPLTLMWPARDRDHGTPIPPDVRTRLDDEMRKRARPLMGWRRPRFPELSTSWRSGPEVDPRRIAVIGLSYGGYYASTPPPWTRASAS